MYFIGWYCTCLFWHLATLDPTSAETQCLYELLEWNTCLLPSILVDAGIVDVFAKAGCLWLYYLNGDVDDERPGYEHVLTTPITHTRVSNKIWIFIQKLSLVHCKNHWLPDCQQWVAHVWVNWTLLDTGFAHYTLEQVCFVCWYNICARLRQWNQDLLKYMKDA